MSLRQEFVELALRNEISFSSLCSRFEITRKTGYKWFKRYEQEGLSGLKDRSRKPHRIARHITPEAEEAIVALRNSHPTWGSRKIRRKLQDAHTSSTPACSTITACLKRNNLIDPNGAGGRRDFKRFEHPYPNSLWQMDFKAPVKTIASVSHPLTLLDDYSRFNLLLDALLNQKRETVKEALTCVFRRYGLPDTILVDNGSPWGRDAEHTHTRLTVWMLHLGIRVSHSSCYHPQTLGKDERFHRTLETDVIGRGQWRDHLHLQKSFDAFRYEYNFERPHDSLELEVPASRYKPSLRAFPEKLPPIEYPSTAFVRKVQDHGEFSFKGHTFKISNAFRGYPIGIVPTTCDGVFNVIFCQHKITQINLRDTG